MDLGSEGPTRQDYLFGSQRMFGEICFAYRDSAVKEARDTPASVVATQSIEDRRAEIVQRWTLTVPSLDLDPEHIEQLPQRLIRVDDSNNPGRIPLRSGGPIIVPGKEVGLCARLIGDPGDLFKAQFRGPSILGRVEDGWIVVREAGINLDGNAAKEALLQRLRQIAATLDGFRKEAEGHNAQLAHNVHLGLLPLYEKVSKEKAIDFGFRTRTPKVESPIERTVEAPARKEARPDDHKFDVFLSHASEDKAEVVLPLHEELTRLGLRVWLDKTQLEIGDSLREKIDEGLRLSRFGIVVLSHSFFVKDWPKSELDGLLAHETDTGKKRILPVWHKVAKADVLKFSSILAGRLAGNTSEGIERLAEKLARAIENRR